MAPALASLRFQSSEGRPDAAYPRSRMRERVREDSSRASHIHERSVCVKVDYCRRGCQLTAMRGRYSLVNWETLLFFLDDGLINHPLVLLADADSARLPGLRAEQDLRFRQ